MFGLFKKPINLTLTSKHSLKDIGKAIKKKHVSVQEVEQMARAGNVSCQEFIAKMTVAYLDSVNSGMKQASQEQVKMMKLRVIEFGTQPAENGDAELQYNLALAYTKLTDISNDLIDEEGIENLTKAIYWYEKASANPMCEFQKEAMSSVIELRAMLNEINATPAF